MDVAQAKNGIAQAEIALQKAEDDLAELLGPVDQLEVSEAKSKAARMELEVQNAKEALTSLFRGHRPTR